MFAMFTIAKTVCCLSFSIFSVQVERQAEYGCDFPYQQHGDQDSPPLSPDIKALIAHPNGGLDGTLM